jgi:uncharacterized protein
LVVEPEASVSLDPVQSATRGTVGRSEPVFERPEIATAEDVASVSALIGRKPKTAFTVLVRRIDGVPVVTRNAPLEADGTPMPTRYWLLPSAMANNAIGRIESTGGVRRAEIEIETSVIEAIHTAYAQERDRALPIGWSGPRPTGGVGGTRTGLKCLHAHYANYLAGNDDAVGAWVEAQIPPEERDQRVGLSAELNESRAIKPAPVFDHATNSEG